MGLAPKASLDRLVKFAINNSRQTDNAKYARSLSLNTIRGFALGIPAFIVFYGMFFGCWTTLDRRPYLTYWASGGGGSYKAVARPEIWIKDLEAPAYEHNKEVEQKIAKGEATEDD